MFRIFAVLVLLSLLTGTTSIGAPPSKIDPKLLHGRWKITESFHTENGEKKEGSPPLMVSFWAFNPDGTYSIQTSVNETGKYEIKDREITMDADKPSSPAFDKRTFKIEALDSDSLTLSIALAQTESLTMISFTVYQKIIPAK